MNDHKTNKTISTSEKELLRTKASRKKSWYQFIKGELILTEGTLYFQPSASQKNAKTFTLTLKHIHATRKATAWGVRNNRLVISDHQGDEHTFVVTKRNQFLEALDKQLNKL